MQFVCSHLRMAAVVLDWLVNMNSDALQLLLLIAATMMLISVFYMSLERVVRSARKRLVSSMLLLTMMGGIAWKFAGQALKPDIQTSVASLMDARNLLRK